MTHSNVMLMRHAKSSWDHEGLSDFQRPLNKRGKRASEQMAEHLAHGKQVPARIFSSTSVRTRETVAIMNEVWKLDDDKITWLDELYLAPPQKLAAIVFENWDASPTLYLAHNPGMQLICSHLAGKELDMPTAAVCTFAWQPSHNPEQVEDIDPKNFKMLGYAIPRALEE